MHFADRIIKTCGEKKSRLVVGLDPHWGLIPDSFKEEHGPEPGSVISAYMRRAVAVCAPHAVAFKPQIAFFEQFGVAGFQALNEVLKDIRKHNGLVIMDGKRNDIGSTAKAYASAYFGGNDLPPAFDSDALTVNAYLGSDGIAPFLEKPERGIFALVKTSNPSSGDFQDRKLENGETLAELVADTLSQWNEPTIGASGYGNGGAVVGATWPEHMRALRQKMPHSLILVPGYGAQGGSAEGVRAAFNDDGLGALINSSRGILFPPNVERDGFEVVEQAAVAARDDINQAIA